MFDFKSLNILGFVLGLIKFIVSFLVLFLIFDKLLIWSKVFIICINVFVFGGCGILMMECKGEFFILFVKLMYFGSFVIMCCSICKFFVIYKYNGIVYF